MRLPRSSLWAVFFCAGGALGAASFEGRVEALFRPPLGEMIALSPDGQRIAYTVPDGRGLAIVMASLEPPGAKRVVRVEPERDALGRELAPWTSLRYLRWAPDGRLVYAPAERIVPLPPLTDKAGRVVPNPDGPTVHAPVFVADAEGRLRGTLIDAQHFQETPADARKSLGDLLRTTKELQATRDEAVRWRMPHLDILGFPPRQPDQLIVRTRGAYSMPMQHLVDIRTGNVREFGSDWPAPPGEPHVFDPYRLKVVGERQVAVRPMTTWRDEELGRVQRELEVKFPRRVVEIVDWSETRTRVLARVTGGTDAGRFFVYQRPEDLVLEALNRAPWLATTKLHETRFFELVGPGDARLSAYVTWPAQTLVQPPPVIVMFPATSSGGAQPAFDPEAQVLADLGFAVVRLNHRNAAAAVTEHLAVEDALALLDGWAAARRERVFDRRRVIAFGRGWGGQLALHAAQLKPEAFRAVIVIEPVGGANAGAELTRPALVLVESGREGTADGAGRNRWQGVGRALEFAELEPGFGAARPAARAAAYRRIEEFARVHLGAFSVKIGPMQEVK